MCAEWCWKRIFAYKTSVKPDKINSPPSSYRFLSQDKPLSDIFRAFRFKRQAHLYRNVSRWRPYVWIFVVPFIRKKKIIIKNYTTVPNYMLAWIVVALITYTTTKKQLLFHADDGKHSSGSRLCLRIERSSARRYLFKQTSKRGGWEKLHTNTLFSKPSPIVVRISTVCISSAHTCN